VLSAEERRWRNRGLLAVAIVLLLVGFARVEHTRPLLVPMVLLVCAVVAIGGLLMDSADFVSPDWDVASDVDAAGQGQDAGLAGNVRLIENHLSARTEDSLLAHRLTRMTDDRLRRLGLDREAPDVRRRLGPTLSAVLDGSVRSMQLADIEECIRRIEELA
jgi:hypothetical protein